MALPNKEIQVTTPVAEIPLYEVEQLESSNLGALHKFLTGHTNVSEAEYRALTLGDMQKLSEGLLAALKEAAVPLASAAR